MKRRNFLGAIGAALMLPGAKRWAARTPEPFGDYSAIGESSIITEIEIVDSTSRVASKGYTHLVITRELLADDRAWSGSDFFFRPPA